MGAVATAVRFVVRAVGGTVTADETSARLWFLAHFGALTVTRICDCDGYHVGAFVAEHPQRMGTVVSVVGESPCEAIGDLAALLHRAMNGDQ